MGDQSVNVLVIAARDVCETPSNFELEFRQVVFGQQITDAVADQAKVDKILYWWRLLVA